MTLMFAVMYFRRMVGFGVDNVRSPTIRRVYNELLNTELDFAKEHFVTRLRSRALRAEEVLDK